MEKRYCKLCGKELTEAQIKRDKHFCCMSCAMTARYQDSELRKKVSEATKIALNKPETKAKHIAGIRKAYEKESFKENLSKAMTQTWQSPDIRQKHSLGLKKTWTNQQYKDKISTARKQQWQKTGFREHMQQTIFNRWQNEEYKQRVGEAISKALNKPEVKAKQKASLKEALNKPETKERMCIANKELANREEVKAKIIATKKKNGTTSSSRPEQYYKSLLEQHFSNLQYQYKSEQYPFNCDFYIPELDLYIELNFHWTHQPRFGFYDKANKEHIKHLNWLKEKAKTSKMYATSIDVWTKRDLAKREYAINNKLNWIVFWSCKDFDIWLKENNYA